RRKSTAGARIRPVTMPCRSARISAPMSSGEGSGWSSARLARARGNIRGAVAQHPPIGPPFAPAFLTGASSCSSQGLPVSDVAGRGRRHKEENPMALYEMRTYTLYGGKMAEAHKLYTVLGFPALKKCGHDKNLLGYYLAD